MKKEKVKWKKMNKNKFKCKEIKEWEVHLNFNKIMVKNLDIVQEEENKMMNMIKMKY